MSGQAPPDRCVVPSSIRDAILNEYSGEQAVLHVQLLSANRHRTPEEYGNKYMESEYISAEARRFGLSDVQVELFPASDEWDAEEADLWLVQPVTRKIASVNQVPTALAKGSTSSDVEAEVVYVGAGREADYANKDVTGKIVLGNSGVGQIFNLAVNQKGAAGALGTGSAGVSANSAGYTLDQLGWTSVTARTEKGGFGWVLSLRQMIELQGYADRGQKIVMRSHVKTKRYPAKMNVVSAAIPGSDPAAGELMIVAHAFETIATPGANDNCAGVGTTMEIARTLSRLIRDKVLPQPKRTIRFLWVPEISGTRAYLFKHPDVADRLIVAMNYDMPGSDLEKTDSYLRMKMTPDSVPSYLNDLIANLLQFVDQTEIRTQTGNNAPFNYRLVPFIAASDHAVFLSAGIPAMQFNHWPDNFYHSSADTIAMTDPTETKRIGFVGAASFYYIATAGAAEAKALAWESAALGEKWMAEVARQSVRLMGDDGAKLPEQYAAAANKVTAAFNRSRGGVESTATLGRDAALDGLIKTLVASLDAVRAAQQAKIEAVFKAQAAVVGIKPVPPQPSARAAELATMIPKKRFKTFSEDMRKLTERPAAQDGGGRGGRGAGAAGAPGAPGAAGAAAAVGAPGAPGAAGGRGAGLPALASSEVSAFINGKRSILDIYNAVRAEYGNVTTSNNDYKFAWVVSPAYPDIDIEAVANAVLALEKNGQVEITKAVPVAPAKKK
jgi:hypothetical protein